jgi:hypothetical protein
MPTRRIVGEHAYARHRRQVADVAIDHAEERADGLLVGGDAVEIAHSLSGLSSRRERDCMPPHVTPVRHDVHRSRRTALVAHQAPADLRPKIDGRD